MVWFHDKYHDAAGVPLLPTNRKLSHGTFQCECNQMFKAVMMYYHQLCHSIMSR